MYGKKNVLVVGSRTGALNMFSEQYNTEIVSSVHFIDTVLFTFIPDLIVFDSVYDVDIRALRKNEKLLWIPVLILQEDLTYLTHFSQIAESPRVILCNTSVSQNEVFLAHLKDIVEKKSVLIHEKASCIVKKALFFVNKNAHTAFSRTDLSSALGVSEDYLSRIFRAELGLCLWEYILLFRLQEAKALLSETNLSASEIAKRTGFSSATYFSRQFKKHFSLSPVAFRKKWLRNELNPSSGDRRCTSSGDKRCTSLR